MIRINLLPHREVRRKRQQQHFFIMLGVTAAIGAAIWFGVHSYLNDVLDNQNSRNAYLQAEIKKLDKQIAEIKKLKEEITALLARKRVVETLQTNRSEVVHLLDQLARQLPEGMYLSSVKQHGKGVTITGFTQSQARVSTLMRNLEGSQQLGNPALVEIKAVTRGTSRINQFTLRFSITPPKPEATKTRRAERPTARKG